MARTIIALALVLITSVISYAFLYYWVRFITTQRNAPSDEYFLLYQAEGGTNNQLFELCGAIRIAAALNRTLIVPHLIDYEHSSHDQVADMSQYLTLERIGDLVRYQEHRDFIRRPSLPALEHPAANIGCPSWCNYMPYFRLIRKYYQRRYPWIHHPPLPVSRINTGLPPGNKPLSRVIDALCQPPFVHHQVLAIWHVYQEIQLQDVDMPTCLSRLQPRDWIQRKAAEFKTRNGISGEYGAAHLRRGDWASVTGKQPPRWVSVPRLVSRVEEGMERYPETQTSPLFLSTNTRDPSELSNLSRVHPLVRYHASEEKDFFLPVFVDQWLCTQATFFIENYGSSYSDIIRFRRHLRPPRRR